MAFQQFKLDRATKQTRGIFDTFVYRPDNGDTFVEIGDPNYFLEARFEEQILDNAVVYVWDETNFGGYYIREGISNPIFGAALTPPQEDAINSIINAPDDALVLANGGVLEPSLLKQTGMALIEGQTSLQVFNGGSPVGFGSQYIISEAGQTLLQRDVTTGRRNIFCGVPVDFTTGLGQQVSGKPYSVTWGIIQEFQAQPDTDATRQGNYAFPAPISFDRVIKNLQFKFTQQVTGVRLILQEVNSSGPIIFQSHTDAEWEAGEGLDVDVNGNGIIDLFDPEQGTPLLFETSIPLWVTIEKFGDDSDLILEGTVLNPLAPGTFLPFTIQDYFIETREELVNSKIYTPVYKNANSTDLTISDLETIAADTSNASGGAFTLNVNVDDVNVFWVYDYAGNWNFLARRLTIALSNGDTYALTRRRRKYTFYKDEQGNWQWYYTPWFVG